MHTIGSLKFTALGRSMLLFVGLLLFVSTIGCGQDKALPETLPADEELQAMLDEVIEFSFRRRHLSTDQHAAWQILHGALAYGPDFLVMHEGQLVRAVDHVIHGGRMVGWTIRPGQTIDGRRGMLAPVEGGTVAGQGHKDQWLAVMSQCDLPRSQEFKVGDHVYTMEDWLRQVQNDVYNDPELSWTVIGLSKYLAFDAEWTAGDESKWRLEKIVRHEVEQRQKFDSGACGGTHRLIGITMALNRYEEEQGKLADRPKDLRDGWALAAEEIRRSARLAKEYQQSDGSFSASYFSRSNYTDDQGEQLGTSGHTLEFLTLALSDKQIKQAWVTRGVIHMCQLLEATQEIDLDCGKLYHALHGLVLYRERRFGKLDFSKWAEEDLAKAATEADEKASKQPVEKGS